MQPDPLRLLTIGGSDPTGGSGIQADLKTFAVHGVYGLSALTALIAGDTTGRRAFHALPAAFVADQLDAVLGDIGASAAKTGLLGSAETIEAAGELLRRYGVTPLVIDPVLVAKSGARLLDEAARLALIRHLLPLATVTTPNLREATALSDRPIETVDDMAEAARAIHALGPRLVMVKGRGLPERPDEVVDVLYDGAIVTCLATPRVPTKNIRGTGCTLSAASWSAWPVACPRARQPRPRAAGSSPCCGPPRGWRSAAASGRSIIPLFPRRHSMSMQQRAGRAARRLPDDRLWCG